MRISMFLLVALVLSKAVHADITGTVVSVTDGDTIKVLDSPTPNTRCS